MTYHFPRDFNVDDLFYLIAKLLVDGRFAVGSSFGFENKQHWMVFSEPIKMQSKFLYLV